jgi:GxxExxY protein
MKGKPKEFSELSNRIIGCSIEVHRILGPGLLESTYQQCLAHELSRNGINLKSNSRCRWIIKIYVWTAVIVLTL